MIFTPKVQPVFVAASVSEWQIVHSLTLAATKTE